LFVYLSREVCCLKPKNNYKQTPTSLNMSGFANSQQALA
jgi:hypothetical protein